jgi:methionyl-tRNA formyltransferase
MALKVDILCTDAAHPVNAWLDRWAAANRHRAEIATLRDERELGGGDFLFLISCHQIVGQHVRQRYRHSLVIHASDLPRGRGWSPLTWAIVEGANEVVVTMLNAEDALDSGDIWAQRRLDFDGTELHDEINARLFDAEIALMDWALDHCDTATARAQAGEPSYHAKRTPADSEIDPARPLAEAFELLRVADPNRYPAFFEFRGQKYRIRIEKM